MDEIRPMCTAMLMIYEQVNAERPGRLRRLTMHQIRWRSGGPPVVTTMAKFAELPPLRQNQAGESSRS
jgi:hypothetical protein